MKDEMERRASPRAKTLLSGLKEVEGYDKVLNAAFKVDSDLDSMLVILGETDKESNKKFNSICVIRLADDSLDQVVKKRISSAAMVVRNACLKRGIPVVFKSAPLQLLSMVRSGFDGPEVNESANAEGHWEKFFINILGEAKDLGVSDIHIEVRRDTATLKYRVNGELQVIDHWPPSDAAQLAQVVYSVVAEETDVTFTPDRPQNGVIDKIIGGERLRVRLATIPASPDGFDMVLRLLVIGKKGEAPLSLGQMGYTEKHSMAILAALAKPVGMIVFSGTTGSGKSTSLKNLLISKIMHMEGRIKVITVEDPPEYYIPGATQVPVVRSKKSDDGESPFAAAIRAAMRSDPNILMVGEVRDAPSAKLLTDAVQSGHPVLTTTHASSAISIISRLAGMDVSRDVLGSPDFCAGLINQSLVPVLCKKCSVSYKGGALPEHVAAHVDSNLVKRILSVTNDIVSSDVRFRAPLGTVCDGEKCNQGVTGRTVVAEVVLPDHVMLGFFRSGDDAGALLHWRAHGGKLIIEHGIEKMIQGIASPVDIEHELGPLASAQILGDGVIDLDSELDLAGGGSYEPSSSNSNQSEVKRELTSISPPSALDSLADVIPDCGGETGDTDEF